MDAAAFGGKDAEESEKRRKAMLATAEDLEARYRVLLPEPRHRSDKRMLTQAPESESDNDLPPTPANKKLYIKIKQPRAASFPSSSFTPKSEPPRRKGRPPKVKTNPMQPGGAGAFPTQSFTYSKRRSKTSRHVSDRLLNHDEISRWSPSYDRFQGRDSESAIELDIMGGSEGHYSRGQTNESDGDPPSILYGQDSPSGMAFNQSRRGRSKRMRMSVPVRYETPVSPTQIAIAAAPATCALLRQASRNDTHTRKTKRTHEPLGAKLGLRVEEPSDYGDAMLGLLHMFWLEVKRPEQAHTPNATSRSSSRMDNDA